MITFDAALSTSKLEAVEYDLGPICCAIETRACAQTRTNIPLGVLTVQFPPTHFLGANVDVHSNESVTISSRAYVTQMATRYLEKPLESYPNYLTPCARDLVEAYDEAREKVGTLDDSAKPSYASKCGAAIFAGPCSRFDALYVLGMCARCLTFPTERMNKAIDRC